MAVDLPKISQEVAEGLLYDFKNPLTAAGLAALEKEGSGEETALTDYRKWRKAFDHLVKAVGIERVPAKGMGAPNGLKPEGVLSLTPEQMQSLVTFGMADNTAGRKSVKSTQAGQFLREFHLRYAPPLLEIMHERALKNATEKFTAFWHKHVEMMTDTSKDAGFPEAKNFMVGMHKLATDSSFGTKLSSGITQGKTFVLDSEKLATGLAGGNASSFALSQLERIFFSLGQTAKFNYHPILSERLIATQQEYFRELHPALTELKFTTTARNDAHELVESAAKARHYT